MLLGAQNMYFVNILLGKQHMHSFMLLVRLKMHLIYAFEPAVDVFLICFGGYKAFIVHMFSGLQNICINKIWDLQSMRFLCFGAYRACIFYMPSGLQNMHCLKLPGRKTYLHFCLCFRVNRTYICYMRSGVHNISLKIWIRPSEHAVFIICFRTHRTWMCKASGPTKQVPKSIRQSQNLFLGQLLKI